MPNKIKSYYQHEDEEDNDQFLRNLNIKEKKYSSVTFVKLKYQKRNMSVMTADVMSVALIYTSLSYFTFFLNNESIKMNSKL